MFTNESAVRTVLESFGSYSESPFFKGRNTKKTRSFFDISNHFYLVLKKNFGNDSKYY